MTPSPSPSSRLRRTSLRAGIERLAFVFVVAVIAAVASERMFWFWSTDLTEHLFVSAFYALAAGVTLWAMARHRVSGWWSLWLATPLFPLVVEGVITPVTYSGGPFVPLFPAWFAFWHGILAFGFLVVGVRALLLARRTALLAVSSVALGVFWGVWSTTLWLPENVEDPELIADQGAPLEVLDPSAFARYAIVFTAVVMVGHLALGRLWPASFEPARATVRLWGGLVVLGAAAWTVVVPWALPMFLAYVALQLWGLRRHERVAAEPTLLARLTGPTPRRPLLALAAMAPAAAITYAALWEVGFSLDAARAVMWTTIAVQTVAGFTISAMALRRAGRPHAPPGEGPGQSVPGPTVATRSTSNS
ncbi:MAG: hypothetical protein AAGA90_03930 [Actinomycetota bacterium]